MKARDGIKPTAIRVKHPGRKRSSADLRRNEIWILLTEDMTGLSTEEEKITELQKYDFTINLPTIKI